MTGSFRTRLALAGVALFAMPSGLGFAVGFAMLAAGLFVQNSISLNSNVKFTDPPSSKWIDCDFVQDLEPC